LIKNGKDTVTLKGKATSGPVRVLRIKPHRARVSVRIGVRIKIKEINCQCYKNIETHH
jgi:hypothetical protein